MAGKEAYDSDFMLLREPSLDGGQENACSSGRMLKFAIMSRSWGGGVGTLEPFPTWYVVVSQDMIF